jgi:hypothetical protein
VMYSASMKPPSSIPAGILPIASSSPTEKHPWLRDVVHLQPTFTVWPSDQPRPRDTKGNKPLASVSGRPAFGEIAILRAFEAEGWEGRWIDNYPLPPTFRTDYWDSFGEKLSRAASDVPLPPKVREIYASICERAGDIHGGGAWDIIAWRGEEIAFAEAKRQKSSDWIKDPQLRWLAAAKASGIVRESLLFVEWTLV